METGLDGNTNTTHNSRSFNVGQGHPWHVGTLLGALLVAPQQNKKQTQPTTRLCSAPIGTAMHAHGRFQQT